MQNAGGGKGDHWSLRCIYVLCHGLVVRHHGVGAFGSSPSVILGEAYVHITAKLAGVLCVKVQGLIIDTLVIGVQVRTWLHSETAIYGNDATISKKAVGSAYLSCLHFYIRAGSISNARIAARARARGSSARAREKPVHTVLSYLHIATR